MKTYAEVRIRWATTAECGRTTAVQAQSDGRSFYRPHFRVGARGEHLGVQFLKGVPPLQTPGSQGTATVEFLYGATGVDYTPLTEGADFEVLEGARVIGRGEVIQRFSSASRARERAIDIAKRALSGDYDLLLACRGLAELRQDLTDVPEHVLDTFRGVDSEADGLPLGSERQYWESDALRQKDEQAAEYRGMVRAVVTAALTELLATLE